MTRRLVNQRNLYPVIREKISALVSPDFDAVLSISSSSEWAQARPLAAF
jgi:hypothetical protein